MARRMLTALAIVAFVTLMLLLGLEILYFIIVVIAIFIGWMIISSLPTRQEQTEIQQQKREGAEREQAKDFTELKVKIAQCGITNFQIRTKRDAGTAIEGLSFAVDTVTTALNVNNAKESLAQAKLSGIGIAKAEAELEAAQRADTEARFKSDCNRTLDRAHDLALDAVKADKPIPNFLDSDAKPSPPPPPITTPPSSGNAGGGPLDLAQTPPSESAPATNPSSSPEPNAPGPNYEGGGIPEGRPLSPASNDTALDLRCASQLTFSGKENNATTYVSVHGTNWLVRHILADG